MTSEGVYEKPVAGFILTMRNVNVKGVATRFVIGTGFILTMRNVNGRKLQTMLKQYKFYINYEECKYVYNR